MGLSRWGLGGKDWAATETPYGLTHLEVDHAPRPQCDLTMQVKVGTMALGLRTATHANGGGMVRGSGRWL